MDENTRKFIEAHTGDDVRRLALQASRFPLVDMPYALQQIEGRQKARRKLPTLYANPETEYPATLAMEQCSGEPAARYKSSLVSGNSLIDMTGGFGSVGASDGVLLLCAALFTLFHWPCSTTTLTVYRETGSLKWTAVAVLLPTMAGVVLCAAVAFVGRMAG